MSVSPRERFHREERLSVILSPECGARALARVYHLTAAGSSGAAAGAAAGSAGAAASSAIT